MSHHLRRSITPILVLATALVPIASRSVASAPASTTTTTTGTVEFRDVPADIEAMAEWAIGLFHEAEMELPPLEVSHHGDDTTNCDGHAGVHRSRNGYSVVDLCTDEIGFPTQAMVLHELAHAWVDHNVDETTRDSFQELRGNEHWHDYAAAAWHDNGIEQAAEIVAWGLFDRPMSMSRINQNSCDELDAGYRTLTGAAPLHGFRDLCGA